jgi:uncharacterized protein YyaL (SSP411 family)
MAQRVARQRARQRGQPDDQRGQRDVSDHSQSRDYNLRAAVDDRRARFTDLDDLTDGVIAAASDAAPDPAILTFLLRRYQATGRHDLAGILEPALARGVETSRDATGCAARARWIEAFVTAAPLSSDPRMETAIEDLVTALRGEWSRSDRVADLLTAVDACLQATSAFETPGLVRDAIDQLERVVGATYRPGLGVATSIGHPDGARLLSDQIAGASSLVAACAITARLPYGMLAEELIQFARRTFWNADAGAFADDAEPQTAYVANCDAARALCRLVRLVEDEEYRSGAVVASDSDYRGDTSRILASQLDVARASAAHAATYALALDDWLSLR